ncbi:MAG: glycosyl hydrolase family 18 protein [Eubacterium sp.]
MNNKLCICYIWCDNTPDENLNTKLKKIDFNKLTHICIAFSKIKEKDGLWLPSVSDGVRFGIEKIKEAIKANNADTKIILSVGGAYADGFCQASQTEAGRKEFAKALTGIIDELELDGADIDWEYPGESSMKIASCKSCKFDFVLLLEELRAQLGSKLLTIAVGSNRYIGIDVARVGKAVDYVFVMTYDLGVMHSSAYLSKMFVTMWNIHGIPKNKLCIGVPIYGKNIKNLFDTISFERASEGKISHFLGQSFSVIDGAKWCFDTEKDVKSKADWARKKDLAGIFCWEISTDKNNSVLNAMYDGIKGL